MARLRLFAGSSSPVIPHRPPTIFGAPFVMRGRASSGIGSSGTASILTTASLTAFPQQGFAKSATFVMRGAARLKMDGQAPFAMRGAAGSVVTGTYALSPTIATHWAKHQEAGSSSSVVQLGAGHGAQLLGGTATADNTQGLGYWSKARTTGDWDAVFTLKRLDAVSPASNALTEEFLLLYFGCTGNGGSFPADVSTWPGTTNPYSHNYRANLRGAALTLFGQTDANPAVAQTVSLGIFQGNDTRTGVAGTTVFPCVQNTVYTCTAKRRGNTVTLSMTDGVSTWSDSWTSTLIAANADSGNIGLVVTPAVQFEIGDLAVTDHIASTTWPNGYAFRERLVHAAQPDLAAETITNHVSFIDTSKVPGDWSWLAPAAGAADPGASSSSRPYGATAPWNVPVAGQPRAANSATLSSLLWTGATGGANNIGNINLSNTDFSFPVFYAAAGTDPNANLPLANDTYTCISSDVTANMHNQPIPWNSAWTVPAGSDGQAIVLDPTTGKEWNLWQVVVHTATKILNISNGSLISGDYRTRTTGGTRSRGCGIPYLAMLLRPWEVAQGRIDHALAMGIVNVSKTGGFVDPATSTDGGTFGVDPGIEEGRRFALDITDAGIEAWVASKPAPRQAAARTIARCLREYGFFITDHAGGATVYLEDRITAGAAWDAIGLVNDSTTQDLLDGLLGPGSIYALSPSPYAATAGKLQSFKFGMPLDIRLELEDGTKLDHMDITYDGAAPSLRAAIRLPTVVSNADLRLFAYYGKAGLGASEENVPGVWQGAALVVDPTTGADLTGKGHTLTRSASGLTNTTLDGRPAVTFAPNVTTSFLRDSGDLSFLDGLAGFTQKFWGTINATNDGDVTRLGGSSSGTARFSIWTIASASSGSTKVLEYGQNFWDGAHQTNQSTESVTNVADGTLRHFIIAHKSATNATGADGETGFDGTSGVVGTATAGTIHPQTGDNFSLGAGTGAQTLSPTMTMGLYELWPVTWSDTRSALADRAERDASLVWTVGAPDAVADTDNSPVGKSFRQDVSAQTDIDLSAHAFDPDAGANLTATAVTAPASPNADYSIVAGKLRVAPHGGASGVDRPVVSVSDGTKIVKVKPYLTVHGGLILTSSEGIAPAFPSSPATVVQTTAANLLTAYNGLTPSQIASGVTLLVAPGGTFSGALNLNSSGIKGNGTDKAPQFPIIIRPGTLVGGKIVDPVSFPAFTITGLVTANGNYNWVRGARLNAGCYGPQGTIGTRYNRCFLTGLTSFDDSTAMTVDWCEITATTNGELMTKRPAQGCRSPFVYRAWYHNQLANPGNAGTHMSVGLGYKDDAALTQDTGCYAFECQFGPDDVASEGMELKTSWSIMERCVTVSAGGAKTLRSNMRHGYDNIQVGCWADRGIFIARGARNRIVDCVTVSGRIGPAIGSITNEQFVALKGGTSGANYPIGENTILTRINNPVIGVSEAGTQMAPTGTILEDCTGSTTTQWSGTFPDFTRRASTYPLYPKILTGPFRTASGAAGPAQVGMNAVYNASD